MINSNAYGEELAYNVLTGTLPECLRLSTISEILSERLRKLPTKSGVFKENTQNSTAIKSQKITEKAKQTLVWHSGKRRKYFTLSRKLQKRVHGFFIF